MAKTLFTRREILRSAGWAAVLLAPVLGARFARAGTPPLKLVTFYYGNGPSLTSDRLFPTRSATAWDWTRATATAALAPHESYLSIARGVRLNGDVNAAPSPHQAGAMIWTTGASDLANRHTMDATGEWWIGQDMSFDHWFAQATGTEKLYLAVGATDNRYVSLSSSGPDRPSVAEEDPGRAYDTVFGSLVTDPGDLEARRAANQRIYVLDTIIGDLNAAKSKFGLSLDERERLERYEATLASIEDRLRAGLGAPGTTLPPRPTETMSSAVPARTAALIDVTTAALGLGLRRSVAFQLSSAYDGAIDYSAFIPGASTAHHNSQHGIGGASGDSSLVTPWAYEQLAYLLSSMRAVTESDGSNLLDNSVVMSGTDTPEGRASHDFHGIDHPTFLFGKAGGRLRADVVAPAPSGGARDYVDLMATAAEVLASDAGVANPYTTKPGFRSLISELMT